MKSYVTLWPNSATNPGDRHRVVEFGDWRRYVDGEASAYRTESNHSTHDEAQAAADELNQRAVNCSSPKDCRYPRCSC